MSDEVFSVSEVNEYVKGKLSDDPILRSISIRGEITDLKTYASGYGHLYFTLKDSECKISCVMYQSHVAQLRFRPENGAKVIATGQITLYLKNGTYQLLIGSMRREGQGELYERYLQMKARLEREGLFQQIYKKPIPYKVKTIGVATSMNGAVLRDIVRVARHRNPNIEILFSPCAVQGSGAENEIARSVRLLDESGKCDVILVGRGGGSIEDLWCFNEEIVARTVFACRTPVISCVGHETDYTICDFAADIRAATPSNAAELAVADISDLQAELAQYRGRLISAMRSGQKNRRIVLERCMMSPVFRDPAKWLIGSRKAELIRFGASLEKAVKNRSAKGRDDLEKMMRLLESLNPDNIKMRGYACVKKGDTYISALNELRDGEQITVEMTGGAFDAGVTNIRRNENG